MVPEMGWTREVVGQLMNAVTAAVDANGDSTNPGPAAKLTMTLGKAVPKD